jgi:superfamily II RNA helicase
MIQSKEEQLQFCRTPKSVLERYHELNLVVSLLTNAARKKARIELNSLEVEHKFLLTDLPKLLALHDAEKNYKAVQFHKTNTLNYIETTVGEIKNIVEKNGFASGAGITEKGRIAAQLQEVHPLAMADLYYGTNKFASLDAAQLAGLFSCFYPLNVSDELKAHLCGYPAMREITVQMKEHLDKYINCEQQAFLITGANYEIAYDLLPYVIQWCYSEDEVACKLILQKVKAETGTFIGEFVKALLKVNAIAQEFERVCELTGDIVLLHKLREIHTLTLKYIATSQSLYL